MVGTNVEIGTSLSWKSRTLLCTVLRSSCHEGSAVEEIFFIVKGHLNMEIILQYFEHKNLENNQNE